MSDEGHNNSRFGRRVWSLKTKTLVAQGSNFVDKRDKSTLYDLFHGNNGDR